MKGLVLKDLMLIKKELKRFFVVLLMWLGYCFILEGNSLLMLCLIFIPYCVFNPFYYDDVVNWNKYVLSMNIDIKKIVGSRYILLFSLSLGSFVVTMISNITVSLLINKNLNNFGRDIIIYVLLILFINLVFSVAIYFNFKNGAEKLKIVNVSAGALPSLLFFAPIVLSEEQILAIVRFAKHNYFLLAILIVIFVISCIYISFLKSVKVIKNKEF